MANPLDPRVKLRHLNCFLEVVRQGGVARAGTELSMTQPAVSKAIAELETILGVALFDRTRRSLSLTSYGEMLVRYATAGLATLRQGLDTIADAHDGVSHLALGALPTVAAGIIPTALLSFSRSSLACRVLVETGPSPYLLELLRTGAIEFFVGRMASPRVMDGLSFEQLYSEELAFVVRPSHPLLGGRPPELRDIARYQLMMPPRQAIIRAAVDRLFTAAGVGRLFAEIETVSNSLGRSYTLMSDAIWIISRGVVERDLSARQLVSLPFDVVATRGPVGITTRSSGGLSLPAQAMIDAIRAAVPADEPPPARP